MSNSQVDPMLSAILQHNKYTDYGKKLGFQNIKTVGAYQSITPLSGYDDYAPLIELTTRLGEKDIFTQNPLAGYALTSGTTGAPRLIPCSIGHIRQYADRLAALTAVKGSSMVLIESIPRERQYMDGVYLDSVTGLAITSLKKKIKDNSHQRLRTAGAWTSPMEVLFPEALVDLIHARILFALLDDTVEQIIAPFTWGVLEVCLYLERNWKVLLEDMEKGSISETVAMPENMRVKLNKKIKPNKQRAQVLRQVFEAGFADPVIPRIWPKCRRIVAAGTGSFRIYTEQLKRFAGSISLDNGFYASSEACIAQSAAAGSAEYVLLPETGFYEFLPLEGSEPLAMSALTPGQNYEVLVTNDSGFYRYRLGDVIHVERMENGIPVLTFSYRKHQTYSFAGEQMNEQHIQQAALAFEQQTGIPVGDCSYWPDEDEMRYSILLEPQEWTDWGEQLKSVPKAGLDEIMEKLLCQVNPAYAGARQEGKLKACRTLCITSQTHLLYRDIERFRRRTAADQVKPIRILDNPAKEKFFFSMIDRSVHSAEEVEYYCGRFRK